MIMSCCMYEACNVRSVVVCDSSPPRIHRDERHPRQVRSNPNKVNQASEKSFRINDDGSSITGRIADTFRR